MNEQDEAMMTLRQIASGRDKALARAERAEARLAELEQSIDDALAEETRREREACAVLCESLSDRYWEDGHERNPNDCAAAIRARGES